MAAGEEEDGDEFPYDIRIYEEETIACGSKAIWWLNGGMWADLSWNTQDFAKREGSPILCSRKLVQW